MSEACVPAFTETDTLFYKARRDCFFLVYGRGEGGRGAARRFLWRGKNGALIVSAPGPSSLVRPLVSRTSRLGSHLGDRSGGPQR